MENYSIELVNNIKKEPEENYELELPEDSEPEEIEVQLELRINLSRFDETWNRKAKLSASYFVCRKCNFVNRDRRIVERHIADCRLEEGSTKMRHECAFCDGRFLSYKAKEKHISHSHSIGKTWQCTSCQYKTDRPYQLKNHYQSHVKKFTCETCEQSFARQTYLTSHQKNHQHGVFATKPIEKFECDECLSSFASLSGIKKHKRMVHSGSKCQCDVCGKFSRNRPTIKRHMQIHIKGECPICHRAVAAHRLKRHIEQHTSVVKYQCDVCNKEFASFPYMSKHKFRVHRVAEVECDYCGKTSKNKQNLKIHVLNHVKAPCSICGKLINPYLMNQHKKAHVTGKPLNPPRKKKKPVKETNFE